ncbi:hypothetical protein NQ317_000535 [Molorchus minor]|uniref:Uncharacterized protein n=1 Tax=Molorchus minor TaxID=1323400 RepID=A0ABQ9IUQ3_9CUCU|nr:hypothetical protein NQ317_000535 [Molorchus minor]
MLLNLMWGMRSGSRDQRSQATPVAVSHSIHCVHGDCLVGDAPKLTTAVAVLLTMVTIGALFYAFFIQDPVFKLETILNSITILLASTELIFGILDLMPCCQKKHYY